MPPAGLHIAAAGATLGANLSLILVLISALMLTAGWRLAARKRFEAHRWVQTIAVCLNAAVVLVWMVRSLIQNVLPEIPARLGQSSYAIATSHAVIGVMGVALGVFVVLGASELVPRSLRFHDYKLYMRTSYAVYMLGTLTGVLLYVVAYVTG